MSRVLPASPNLEHLKKEAKVLLRAASRGEPEALERFRAVGHFSAAAPPKLSDAHHLLANEYGFTNWSSLKSEVLVRASDANPFAALAAAVRAGDTSRASSILSRHSNLKRRLDDSLPNDDFGGTALTTAASAKSQEMIRLLLDAGANIDAKTHWWAGGFGVLEFATPETAALLLERGATVSAVSAAKLGMIERLTELLDADPSRVGERGGDGHTPLHVAATVDIARLLLDRGADIDALDVDHESTPAMYLVREHTDVTQYLISRGCRTDILMAAAVGDLDLVRGYLDRDPEAIRTTVSAKYFPQKNPRAGGTIYIWTLGGNKSVHVVAREFGHENIINFLMERTPDVVALAVAAEIGDERRVDELLERQPSLPSMLGPEEQFRLLTSAEANNTRAVHLMLRVGWQCSAGRGVHATALHWAGFHGNAEMVRDLIAHNAPVDATEPQFNGTPLGWTLYGSLNCWHRRTGDYPASASALLAAGAALPENPVATDEVLAVLS
ncbi:MAG: ankyrin repeat domain-containing protein [Gemmatimonadaceae bacterium]